MIYGDIVAYHNIEFNLGDYLWIEWLLMTALLISWEDNKDAGLRIYTESVDNLNIS